MWDEAPRGEVRVSLSKAFESGRRPPSQSDAQRIRASRIKKMYVAAILWPSAIITAVCSAVIGIACICRSAWGAAAAFSALFLAAAAALLFLRLYFRSRAYYGIDRLECKSGRAERLAALFAAKQYADDLYESTLQRDGISCTVRIVQMDCLHETGFQAIRARMRSGLPKREKRVGLFSGGRTAQIVFVVCDRATPAALDKVAAIPKTDLNRTECRFYAVLSLADGSVYFPAVFDGLEYLQVKRYAVFCEMVTSLSPSTREGERAEAL